MLQQKDNLQLSFWQAGATTQVFVKHRFRFQKGCTFYPYATNNAAYETKVRFALSPEAFYFCTPYRQCYSPYPTATSAEYFIWYRVLYPITG